MINNTMYTYIHIQICIMCLCVLLVSFLLNLITFPQKNTWHIKTGPLLVPNTHSTFFGHA